MGELSPLAFVVQQSLKSCIADQVKSSAAIAERIERSLLTDTDILLNAIADSGFQPDHILQVNEELDWTMQHSFACRAAGDLFHCRTHELLTHSVRTFKPGRYTVTIGPHRRLVLDKRND